MTNRTLSQTQLLRKAEYEKRLEELRAEVISLQHEIQSVYQDAEQELGSFWNLANDKGEVIVPPQDYCGCRGCEKGYACIQESQEA